MHHRIANRVTLTLALMTVAASHALAQGNMGHAGMGGSGSMGGSAATGGNSARAGQQAMTLGEVRKVDLGAQTITLKHGDIANLDMPGMTMAFRVKSPDVLKQVKAGDKVRFSAEMPAGVLTVTAIEVLK